MHEPANSADVALSQSFDSQKRAFSCMRAKNWLSIFRGFSVCIYGQTERVPAHAGVDLLSFADFSGGEEVSGDRDLGTLDTG